MSYKKGLISISTIVVLVLGVVFAAKFIGGREDVANVKPQAESSIQSDNSATKINNDVAVNTNTNTDEKITNKMDVAYINDKTNVGIYTVKENDTVFSIVKTHMPSFNKSEIVEFIKDRNNMSEAYKISEGDKIVIPYETAIQTSSSTTTTTKTVVDAKVLTSNGKYTVKKQDTLTSIAKSNMPSYNVKEAITMLKETNKIIDENAIKDGMIINIPK
ncbi:MAG: LysM peptidoglycan-binding domain-containing protein [Clostridium sp.]|uniref:LysM peptidoglycan-binding domain-containing protein n=1 Tax=Clostridium sp. TaxID=1506 RepID=UPI003D6D71F5